MVWRERELMMTSHDEIMMASVLFMHSHVIARAHKNGRLE